MENWYNKSIQDCIGELQTDERTGLDQKIARKRLDKYGENKLRESQGRSPVQMFIDQFKDVLIIILLASALISGLLGEISDVVVIGIILLLNATLGVVQEYKAEKSLAALKEMAAPEALVLRDGQQQKISADQLVPGDVVLLNTGDYIPADLRLVSTTNLKLEESILTGESVPVNKNTGVVEKENPLPGDQSNMAFMGTAVTYGRAKGIVVSTGMDTEMGSIADMLDTQEREPTPLQKRLNIMGKKLGILTLIIVLIVIAAGLIRGIHFLDIFMTGISLAVAAVPEGLPAVVTIVLALGVQRMIKKNAIIRRLPAVETLGATTVICSDKTGTLTQNQMTVRKIYTPSETIEVEGEGYNPEGKLLHESQEINVEINSELPLLIRAGALCNNSELKFDEENGTWNILGDPTEGALVVLSSKTGFPKEKLNKNYRRIREFPFDSERKRMSTININPGGDRQVFVKGAPDEVIKICKEYRTNDKIAVLDDSMKEEIQAKNEEFARKALRVLAVAYKPLDSADSSINNLELEDVENDLIFLGLLGMIDPPRKEVADSVKICKKAGIRPVMITGDYSVTAKQIASELGIYNKGDLVINGPQLESMPQQELENIVNKTSVYARVSPKHKSRIVDALQKNNEIVAMTGDGVNDAPALKKSNIGVAMGITGTDVTKEASDMILTDDNFSSIVAAVEEGRNIYQNIKKFIRFLLSCNIGEVITIFLAIISGMPSPLIPIQILWVNLVTDGLPALALGIDPASEDLMKDKPRDPDEGIFAGKMFFNILTQGGFVGLITLTAFYIGLSKFSVPAARTMAFGTLSLSQLFHSFNSRSARKSLFKIGFFSNKYLIAAFSTSLVLQLGVMSLAFLQPIFEVISLNLTQWLIVLALSISPIAFVEIMKVLGLTYKNE